MRYLLMIGAAALAAVAATGLRLNSSASAAADARADPEVERFLLQASGNDADCIVERLDAPGPVSRVLVAPACDAMLPGLSALHYWREQADGTVMLSADGTTPSVIFAQADGVAYESIEPRTPLMSLISRD
jgi:hypothetical protein